MAKTAVKPAGRRKRGAQTKMTLALFSMMLPGLIYLIINNYIPMAGLVIAFKRFNYGKGIWGSDWAGLSNFTYLFKTQDAKNIIRNTIGYNLTFILLGNVLAVAVAVMLNFMRGTLNKKIYQTVILVPYLISMVVVSYIVFGFLSQENGFLNKILVAMGKDPVSWYTTSKYWPFILVSRTSRNDHHHGAFKHRPYVLFRFRSVLSGSDAFRSDLFRDRYDRRLCLQRTDPVK